VTFDAWVANVTIWWRLIADKDDGNDDAYDDSFDDDNNGDVLIMIM